MRADYRLIRSSDAEKVIQIDRECKDSIAAQQEDFDREYECWDAYFAINGGQWAKKDLAKLREQDRHPWTFDVIGNKTDTLAGSLIAELPDCNWIPVEGEKTSGSDSVTESYYSDKELANSEDHLIKIFRDGLVHVGVGQLVETQKYEKPVIGLERVLPGRFVPSRYWLTDNDRDMMESYKIAYYTADGIAYKWDKKHDAVMDALRRLQQRGRQATPQNAEERRRAFDGSIGDEYKVIEYHWLERLKTKRLLGLKVDPETMHPSWVPFPVIKDRSKLEQFAAANAVDWETVFEDDYEDIIHHVSTICPDLDKTILLEDGKSKIQVKGLPFFFFTVTRYGGKNKGIVQSLLDIQRTINSRESMVTELVSKAGGGSTLVDKGIFEDPKQEESFRKNANKPGHMEMVDFSGLKGNPVYPVVQSTYPSEVLNQIARMYDQVLPLVSRVSDSMSAITDSGKSGVLFEKEYQVNRIGNLLMDKGIKQFLNNWGEAYFYQWQVTYAGEMRQITARDGRRLYLNEPVPMADGMIGIRNAVEYTPRCRVIISDTKNSPTSQMRYRNIWTEALGKINPELNPEQYMFVFTRFMETLDMDDKAKGELRALNQMSLSKVQMRFIADMSGLASTAKQNQLTAVQAEQALAQIMGTIQQPQPEAPQQSQEQITAPSQQTIPATTGNETPAMGI
jgi:hypothetical protein